MIFSLFRNGKELDVDCFRFETEEILYTFVEMEIWDRFIQKHVNLGGIIKHKQKFIEEAKSMGYSVGPVFH